MLASPAGGAVDIVAIVFKFNIIAIVEMIEVGLPPYFYDDKGGVVMLSYPYQEGGAACDTRELSDGVHRCGLDLRSGKNFELLQRTDFIA